MKTPITALLAGLMLTTVSPAYGQAVGSIAGWERDSADIVVVNGDAVPFGEITEDGLIVLELPDTMAAAQPFGVIFSCSAGTVMITNPDASYYVTPNSLIVADMDAKKMLGSLTPAGSEAAGKAAPGMFRGDTVTGTLYQWFYLSAPAALDGECVTKTAYKDESGETIDRVVVYDAEFSAGWNLVSVDIAAVAKPMSEDRTIATQTTYTTIDALPDATIWVFAGEE